MPHFADLSEYEYASGCPPGVKNVGWLDAKHAFPRASLETGLLDAVWAFCKISVLDTRGKHYCEFCQAPTWDRTEYGTECLSLGGAEIRVFGLDGQVYAAPNLIFHYMAAHCYDPPQEFKRAALQGPRPPQSGYFRLLEAGGWEWRPTWVPNGTR